MYRSVDAVAHTVNMVGQLKDWIIEMSVMTSHVMGIFPHYNHANTYRMSLSKYKSTQNQVVTKH